MNRYLPYFILLALALLIVFDAAQQYYYMTSFNLVPQDSTISFSELFVSHLIRWTIWLVASIPYLFFVKQEYAKSPEHSPLNMRLIVFIGLTLFASLVIVSFHSIYSQNTEFTLANFKEFYLFFFYQKGLTFLLATVGASLLIANYAREKSLKVQLIEIKELKRTNHELKKSVDATEVPHLNIKTGYKLKPIPVDEIVWIQSDDYCVKVHTKEKTYTLRKSLKVLEKKLSGFRFIRIHRSALLNLDYLDQINYRSSTVRLKNRSEVPASRTGIKKLKSELIKA